MPSSKISRILKLLVALQSETPLNASNLADHLGTNRRTVFRDMKALREAGVCCNFDNRMRRYSIKSPLPIPELNTSEIFALLLILQKIAPTLQLPLKQATASAALKIQNYFPVKIRRHCLDVIENISIIAEPQADIASFDKLFLTLLDALKKNAIIKITYLDPRENAALETNIHPYHLFLKKQCWHLTGYSVFHKKTYDFKLNNITRFEILDKLFVEEKPADISDYLDCQWSIPSENRLYHVELRFSASIAKQIAAVKWHQSQKSSFRDDGSVIVSLCIKGLSEITYWILSYGNDVEVLSPEVLRKKIANIAGKIKSIYI